MCLKIENGERMWRMQLQNGLKEGTFIKEAVFLAIDNVQDSGSVEEAKRYLSAALPGDSIVVVTSRYKESLVRCVDGDACVGMPELEREEARSLFLTKSCDGGNGVDEELIERCMRTCHFRMDEREGRYVYHPLALVVLGSILGNLGAEFWDAELERIGNDPNQRENGFYGQIFTILRKSFDTLGEEDQLLFMDVALFMPQRMEALKNSVFEWLGLVHRIPKVQDVRVRVSSF